MCSHYQEIKNQERLERTFRLRGQEWAFGQEMWPARQGMFICRSSGRALDSDGPQPASLATGRWGMVAPWAKGPSLVKALAIPTFNARSETADKLRTFRNAWKSGQRCIIPADSIWEPDHRQETKQRFRTSSPIPTRFERADGQPMAIAGLWDLYQDENGQPRYSFTMLTVNADADVLFKHFHAPHKEKRMVVILPQESFDAWLHAPVESTRDLLVPIPSDQLIATPVLGQDSRQALLFD